MVVIVLCYLHGTHVRTLSMAISLDDEAASAECRCPPSADSHSLRNIHRNAAKHIVRQCRSKPSDAKKGSRDRQIVQESVS